MKIDHKTSVTVVFKNHFKCQVTETMTVGRTGMLLYRPPSTCGPSLTKLGNNIYLSNFEFSFPLSWHV